VLSACVLLLLCLLAILFGQVRMGSAMLGVVPLISLCLAGLLWIALTSAPIYFLAVLAGWILAFCFIAPVSLALALGADEWLVATTCCIVVVLLLFAAWRGLRARGIPIPWELGLVLLAFMPEFLRRAGVLELGMQGELRDTIPLFFPLLLLLGGLLFARRTGLISWKRVVITMLACLLVTRGFIVLVLSGAQLGPLTEPDAIFFWIAACFAPVVWIPLSVRLQRHG
jgi:hypothetical protein